MTAYQIQTGYPGNLNDNGVYDNKGRYLSQLGLSDDGTSSGIDPTYQGPKIYFTWTGNDQYHQLGVKFTKITGVYAKLHFSGKGENKELPDLEEEIVARGDDLQVKLEKLGLGLLMKIPK